MAPVKLRSEPPPALVEAAGFEVEQFNGHAYVQAAEPAYFLTLVDRGAGFLVAADRIGDALAEALKAEARRRVEQRRF